MTSKQTKVCDIIKQQISYWSNARDLFSPTHTSDLCQTISTYMSHNQLTQDEGEDLQILLIELLCFIRSLK
jgi:hypothetical protein